MNEPREASAARHGVSAKQRLEALSDGIFAIAFTFLVLPMLETLPHARTLDAALLNELGARSIGFGVGFVSLGLLWVGHFSEARHLVRSDRLHIWIKLGFLFCVSLVPVGAGLLGAFPREAVAVLAFGLTLSAAMGFLVANWAYATRGRRLVADGLGHEVVSLVRRRQWTGIAGLAASSLLAPFSPPTAIVSYAIVCLVLISLQWRDKDEPG
jgi:uncharacterized membrane protein